MKVNYDMKPIYNENSQILFLGSLPSVISRQENFYYANKSNRFWKIIEIIFDEKLKDNKKRKDFVLNKNIALWNVIRECDIEGSSDSTIKNVKYNNIYKLLKKANIKAIFCIGKKAYNLLLKKYNFDIPVIYLPSTSSANAAINLKNLVDSYTIINKYLD